MTTFHTEIGPANGLQAFGLEGERLGARNTGASILVKASWSRASTQLPSRTLAKYRNGLSRNEAVRLSEAAHFMVSRGPVIFVSLSRVSRDDDSTDLWQAADKLKNHVRTFATRNGAPSWWADLWETRPHPHVHLIAAAPPGKVKRMCEAIEASSVLGDVKARPVTDANGLVAYLMKEQTTEAWFAGGRETRRLRGSHKLPDGGDRQHLSRALEGELLAAGVIEPWRKTNARRAARVVNIDALDRGFGRARLGLFFADELSEAKAPTKAKGSARKRDKIAPPSLLLDYGPTVAELLARLGPTHQAIGVRVGLSRPQVTNIIQGRFGMSLPIVHRVMELTMAAA